MTKESSQTPKVTKKFKLGPLGNLNQVTKGLAKTIRAMADGTLDSQERMDDRLSAFEGNDYVNTPLRPTRAQIGRH
jgi:hypothetical protein